MTSVWRIFRYLKFYPWNIAGNLLLNTLAVFFNMFTFIMIVPFVELLFGTSQPPASLPPFSFDQEYLSLWMTCTLAQAQQSYGLWRCLVAIALAYVAFSFLSNLCRYMAQFVISPMRNGITMRLRNDLYHHITILPVSYFAGHRRGDLISRMSNDLADVEWSIVSTLQSLVKDPINILFFSATLIFISPKLFFYFLLIRPQQKQQKEQKKLHEGLKVGDKVVTAGGIYGIIREVQDSTVKLEIAANTVIKIAKTSIAASVAKDGKAETK